ncbi:hypothetical protein BASA81_016712 [Batrachochytrium salamandrivorans]|nr:hypothetical protein BASA81_016712 [Batrachochytrium salamandrivorans]
MTIPLILSASTKRNVLLGSVGSGNTLTLGCNPCSIRGKTTLLFKAQGKLFHTPKISVTWEGDLDITAIISLKAQADIVLKSSSLTLLESPFTSIHIPGVLNLGPSVKLVASARASLTAAISVELELSAKIPKFFTKLSASEKVAQYPIEPEYSVSASATALVSGETKFTIGPQLALNVGVFGLDIPKTSIEMEVASYMDFSVKGKLQKKIISNGEKGEIATLTALANIGIRAGVSANLFGVCFSLYISPILKVFTKEYKTLMFDEPPAEVVSIESAVKLSAQAIKHAIEHPLIGANPKSQNNLPYRKPTTIHRNAHPTPSSGPGKRGIALGFLAVLPAREIEGVPGTLILAKVPGLTEQQVWTVGSIYLGKTNRQATLKLVERALELATRDHNRPIIIGGDWNAPHATLQRKVSSWGFGLHVVSFSGSKATFRGRTATARWSSIDHFVYTPVPVQHRRLYRATTKKAICRAKNAYRAWLASRDSILSPQETIQGKYNQYTLAEATASRLTKQDDRLRWRSHCTRIDNLLAGGCAKQAWNAAKRMACASGHSCRSSNPIRNEEGVLQFQPISICNPQIPLYAAG